MPNELAAATIALTNGSELAPNVPYSHGTRRVSAAPMNMALARRGVLPTNGTFEHRMPTRAAQAAGAMRGVPGGVDPMFEVYATRVGLVKGRDYTPVFEGLQLTPAGVHKMGHILVQAKAKHHEILKGADEIERLAAKDCDLGRRQWALQVAQEARQNAALGERACQEVANLLWQGQDDNLGLAFLAVGKGILLVGGALLGIYAIYQGKDAVDHATKWLHEMLADVFWLLGWAARITVGVLTIWMGYKLYELIASEPEKPATPAKTRAAAEPEPAAPAAPERSGLLARIFGDDDDDVVETPETIEDEIRAKRTRDAIIAAIGRYRHGAATTPMSVDEFRSKVVPGITGGSPINLDRFWSVYNRVAQRMNRLRPDEPKIPSKGANAFGDAWLTLTGEDIGPTRRVTARGWRNFPWP